jgi:hypothetical protein
MKFIIAIVLLFVLAVVVLMLRSSGPRVTHIEHRRDKHDERGDDDA